MLLALSIVAGSTMLGLAAGLFAGRGLLRRHHWGYAALIPVLIGLALVVTKAERVAVGWERRNWTAAPGIVIDSRVKGTRAYHAEVVYEYTIDGVTYRDSTALHQPSFGGRTKRHDVAVKGAALYSPGEQVTVFYDPGNPHQSDLVTSVYWADYAATSLGALLLASGIFLGTAWIRRRSGRDDSSLDESVA